MIRIERIAEKIIEESNEAYNQHEQCGQGYRVLSYEDILAGKIEDALRVERERCNMLAEALEFYAIRDKCFDPKVSPAKEALAALEGTE